VIEKHFTLSHDHSDFRDHALSAEPDELARLVREAEAAAAAGSAGDVPEAATEARRAEEEPNRAALRRSIVAGADLPAGRNLSEDDLTWMRPRDGLAPGEEGRLVGRSLVRGVGLGETIRPEDVD
jgi:sialic acid synthase SpsE